MNKLIGQYPNASGGIQSKKNASAIKS